MKTTVFCVAILALTVLYGDVLQRTFVQQRDLATAHQRSHEARDRRDAKVLAGFAAFKQQAVAEYREMYGVAVNLQVENTRLKKELAKLDERIHIQY